MTVACTFDIQYNPTLDTIQYNPTLDTIQYNLTLDTIFMHCISTGISDIYSITVIVAQYNNNTGPQGGLKPEAYQYSLVG
jgi:hypothetical protein